MNRIKELRKEHKITQEKLAAILGISRSAIAMYETEKCDLSNDILISCASFFDVSTDYLLGQSDIRKPASRPTVDDDDIKFALFGTTDIDDATLEDIKAYARFKREQYNKR